MKKEERFKWFFDEDWKTIRSFLVKLNTGARMMSALKAFHSGKSGQEAGRVYGLSRQALHQWLVRRGGQIKEGVLTIGKED